MISKCVLHGWGKTVGGVVHLRQSETSCFWNGAPGPERGEQADEGEGEEGGRDAQCQAKVWHHLGRHSLEKDDDGTMGTLATMKNWRGTRQVVIE